MYVIMIQEMLPNHLMFDFSFQVLRSKQPLIVYFPDSSEWLSRAVPKSNRKEFVHKVQEMFDQLSGPVVLICGQNKVESGSKEKEKFVSFMNLMLISKLYIFTNVFEVVYINVNICVLTFIACYNLWSICSYIFLYDVQQTMILPNFGRLAKLVMLANL